MNRITNFVLLFLYIIFSIILGFLIGYFSSPECFRNECVNKSATIIQNMDLNIDPCEDFYGFICGNPGASLSSSRDSSKKTSNEKLLKSSFNRINYTYILTKDSRQIKTKSIFDDMESALYDYWKKVAGCTIKVAHGNYHERLMFSLSRIFSYGTAPSTAKQDMGIYMFDAALKNITRDGKSSGIKNIFMKSKWIKNFSLGLYKFNTRKLGFPGGAYTTFHLGRDRDDRDSIAPYFGLAGVLPYSYNDLFKNRAGWNFSLPYMWKMFVYGFKGNGTVQENKYGIYRACSVWFKVMDVREQAIRKPVGGLRKISLEGLERMFSNKFDFKGFLSRGVPPGHEIPRYVYLMPGTTSYFAGLARIFKRFTKFELACYMALYNYMSIIPHLRRTGTQETLTMNYDKLVANDQFYTEFYYRKLYGLMLSCGIERFHIRRSGSEILNEIFHYLNQTMEEALLKTPWMDAKTKRFAIKKLYLMNVFLSISKEIYESLSSVARIKYYTGLCIGDSDFDTMANTFRFFMMRNLELYSRKITGFDDISSQIITADYEYEKNNLVVPVLILNFPRFENVWPRSLNYGLIGIRMAHYLTKAFDFKGSNYNELGYKLEKPWWTSETLGRFKQKENDCSRSSRIFDIKNNLTDEDLTNGFLLSQQWRLVTAIKIAFEAYSKQRDESWVRETSLPGLESYSSQQIFFMSFANGYCYPHDEAELVNNRALFKTISEMEIFRDAFNCKNIKVRSKTSDKCMMW